MNFTLYWKRVVLCVACFLSACIYLIYSNKVPSQESLDYSHDRKHAQFLQVDVRMLREAFIHLSYTQSMGFQLLRGFKCFLYFIETAPFDRKSSPFFLESEHHRHILAFYAFVYHIFCSFGLVSQFESQARILRVYSL